MAKTDTETFYASSQQEWRKWLKKHHNTKESIWLIYYKKASGVPSLSWSQAVDEALCFGWIDSTARAIDEEKYMQYFCRRKPRSPWSKINKDKVERLAQAGLMAPAGIQAIELAMQNGSWTVADEAETGAIPPDLQQALVDQPGAEAFFTSLSPSVRKNIINWLTTAKRPETRQKRAAEIATQAALSLKPKQF